jgi:hypothetical protein
MDLKNMDLTEFRRLHTEVLNLQEKVKQELVSQGVEQVIKDCLESKDKETLYELVNKLCVGPHIDYQVTKIIRRIYHAISMIENGV